MGARHAGRIIGCMATPEGNQRGGRWTFLTNHARVLLEIARRPDVRLRDVALTAGITERAVQAIVSDLEAAGYLTRTRVGRRNRYVVDPNGRYRHPAEAEHNIGELLALFTERDTPAPPVAEVGPAGPSDT
jgi:DNA-binding MarR family transcriptional regulator